MNYIMKSTNNIIFVLHFYIICCLLHAKVRPSFFVATRQPSFYATNLKKHSFLFNYCINWFKPIKTM